MIFDVVVRSLLCQFSWRCAATAPSGLDIMFLCTEPTERKETRKKKKSSEQRYGGETQSQFRSPAFVRVLSPAAPIDIG